MVNDTQTSLRMPRNLKVEIDEIAAEVSRSSANTMILLLRRGIDAYRADGVLVDTRPKHLHVANGVGGDKNQELQRGESGANQKRTGTKSKS